MSFEKRKAVPLAAAFLVAVGIGSTATADTGVEIYSTNVTLNGGDIGLGGGDIRDSGVVVWNSSQGYVPSASVETAPIQSGTTASDVGLGQVENEAQVAESGDTLSGTLNLGGNDLTSSGTTVYDSANGFVPASSVEINPIQSGTTSSDVGLGQVENEAQVAESGDTLSGSLNLGGNDLTSSGTTVWDSTNGFVPAASVETNPIQSGTTASDVGLGQVENEAQVAESGDKMTGTLNMTGNTIDSVAAPSDSDDAAPRSWINNNDDFEQDTNDGYLPDDSPSNPVDFGGQELRFVDSVKSGFGGNVIRMEQTSDDDIILRPISDPESRAVVSAKGDVRLEAGDTFSDSSDVSSQIVLRQDNNKILLNGDNSNSRDCEIQDDTLNCDGSKNWIHDLNSTHEAYYSSQESPEVRAVYEGQTATSNGVANVSLPSHFSKTVSDTRPSLRVQATPHSLASVAVTERTDDYLVVESSKDVTVDYRVTGIREGYEDKQVVRKK